MRALPRTTCTTGSSIAKRVQVDATMLPAGELAAHAVRAVHSAANESFSLFRLSGQLRAYSSINITLNPSFTFLQFVTAVFQSTLYCFLLQLYPLMHLVPLPPSCLAHQLQSLLLLSVRWRRGHRGRGVLPRHGALR